VNLLAYDQVSIYIYIYICLYVYTSYFDKWYIYGCIELILIMMVTLHYPNILDSK